MNVYIIPFSEDELGDQLFSDAQVLAWKHTVILWRKLKAECAQQGIRLQTIDFFDPKRAQPDDALLVLNHPEESFWWRLYYLWKYRKSKGGFVWRKRKIFFAVHAYFKRKILLQLEAPVVAPATYRRLPSLAKLYTEAYFIVNDLPEKFGYVAPVYDIYNGRDKREMIKKYAALAKDKYLCMINANNAPHEFWGSLLGERIKAIKFFSRFPDFDLYGSRWNWPPRHPWWWFWRSFVKKAWRGAPPDKLETLSRYKFALVFENCAYPGYVSEKIFDCFVSGVVPVYLGAPDIHAHIPGDCFVDFRRFSSYAALDEFLRSLTEQDLAAYRRAASEFLRSGKDRPFTQAFFAEKLLEIINPELRKLAAQVPRPLVSVVLPAYNDAKYLKGAITSVLAQTYENWELVVADDGSTDNTKAVASFFGDKRIHYFYQANKGLASARNFGLAHCRGKYVALLDADDLFLPEKLERHVAYLEKHPECDLTYDELIFIRDEEPGKFWKVIGIEHLSGFLKEPFIKMAGHCIGPSAAFFRRELFQEYGGFPDGWRRNEDYYFWLKLAVRGAYFQHLKEPLTISRLRAQSLSRSGIHLKEAAELNLQIFDWLDKELAKDDFARGYLPDFLSVTRRRLALGYFILQDKESGIRELKKWRYGWLLTPFFRLLPSRLLSSLLTRLRGAREKFLYQETAGPLGTIPPPVLH